MRSHRGSRRFTAPVVVVSTLFVLALTAQPASAVSLEFEEVRPQVGFEPNAVQVGDVDGDGVADLVLRGDPAGGVSVARGNGDGTFAAPFTSPPVTWSDGTVGFAILAVGDVNADGRTDVAVALSEVAVFLGRADGTLAEQRIVTSAAAGDIVMADLNGDGNGDLVMTAAGGVSVALSSGDGTFGEPTGFAANRVPGHVAVADIDEDGHLDVVVANDPRTDARKTVSVLLGNGDGTLSEPLAVPDRKSVV